jgi:thioredoxin reductase
MLREARRLRPTPPRLPAYDAIIVGGGPAGLSAALILGRCRRRVLLCDAGRPRNAASRALHGFLTRDGIRPGDLRAIGRRQLAKYGVEFLAAEVADARRRPGGFEVRISGGRRIFARKLLFATGVVDRLPEVDGVRALYGESVFHCPYCDGWEWRDRRLAALGGTAVATGLALALRTWSHDVVLCTNGRRIDRETRARLVRNAIQVRHERVEALDHRDGLLKAIVFAAGDTLERDVVFFNTGQHPQSELAVRLGCSLTRHGTVKTGTLCDTNIPRVFVAGDASRDAQFVVVAAAEGVKAAVAINKALQAEELVK